MREIILKRGIAIIFVIIASFILGGCGEDIDDDWGEAPCWRNLCSGTSTFQGEVASNAKIIVEFWPHVDYARIDVSNCKGSTIIDGPYSTRAIWTPLEDMNLGDYELVIDASYTEDGVRCMLLESFAGPHSFTVIGPDGTTPKIIGTECEPKNGATDVDPYRDRYKWFEVKFSEWLLKAQVTEIGPKWEIRENIAGDALELYFGLLPYDTKFTITLNAADLAGNIVETEYSFTTIKKLKSK